MMPAGAPTVFVIDDDTSVRESIRGLLKSVSLRSEAFATAREFLGSKRPDGPSCLVLDVRLPGVSGLDFQRELADAGVCGAIPKDAAARPHAIALRACPPPPGRDW